jgi:hypothetical protein
MRPPRALRWQMRGETFRLELRRQPLWLHRPRCVFPTPSALRYIDERCETYEPLKTSLKSIVA